MRNLLGASLPLLLAFNFAGSGARLCRAMVYRHLDAFKSACVLDYEVLEKGGCHWTCADGQPSVSYPANARAR